MTNNRLHHVFEIGQLDRIKTILDLADPHRNFEAFAIKYHSQRYRRPFEGQ